MLPYLLLIIWIFGTTYSFLSNNDIFSPAKILLGFVLVSMLSMFVYELPLFIHLSFLFYTLSGIFLARLEHQKDCWIDKAKVVECESFLPKNRRWLLPIFFWALSLFPVIAFLLFVYINGGFCEYINNIGVRVKNWAGMGVYVAVIRSIAIINVMYFTYNLYWNVREKRWWSVYAVHAVLTLTVLLFLGSRGAVLWPLVMIWIIFSYKIKRMSIISTIIVVTALFIVAVFLGTVRGYIRCDSGASSISVKKAIPKKANFSTLLNKFELAENESGVVSEGEAESKVGGKTPPIDFFEGVRKKIREVPEFSYGIIGLVVFSEIEFTPSYGLTYLTGFTNLIPRKLWPDKPDTAGVLLTKYSHGKEYEGLSHYAPGFLAESMLNFGRILGYILGMALFLIIVTGVNYLYVKIVTSDKPPSSHLVIYLYIMMPVMGLVVADFGYTIYSMILNQLSIMLIMLLHSFLFSEGGGVNNCLKCQFKNSIEIFKNRE